MDPEVFVLYEGKTDKLCLCYVTRYTGNPLLYTTGLVYTPNTIKSYKNHLQNTQHMVLHNQPTLSMGTERLACLNSPPPPACSWGPSLSRWQVPGSSPGPRRCAARAFFLHPPFLPPWGDFFAPSPPTPQKC